MWHFCDFFHRALLSSCVAVLAAAFVGPGGRACGAEAMGLVKGIVVDEAGKPVPGARVRAERSRDDGDYEVPDPFAPALDVTTDAEGRFQAQLPAHEYWGRVTKGLLTSAGVSWKDRHWTVKASTPLDVRITLRKGRRIEGIVVKETDGTPVASAKIVSGYGVAAMTDGAGRFTIEGVGEWERRLTAIAPGLATTHVDERTEYGPNPSLEIEMPPGFTVRGRVADEAGRPIAGALLTAGAMLTYAPSLPWTMQGPCTSECLTDAEGKYALGGLLADDGPFWVVAIHRDYARVSGKVAPAKGRDKAVLDLTMGQGFALDGTVRGPDGKPIQDARVSCAATLEEYDPPHMCTRTDANGFFRLDHLLIGTTKSINAWARGYKSTGYKDVKVDARPGRDAAAPKLSIDLEKIPMAVGRVADTQGRPVPGACVRAIAYPGRAP